MVVGSNSATVTWFVVGNSQYRPTYIATYVININIIIIPILVITRITLLSAVRCATVG
jgi:hypothetical protein